jgi:hypothetical protein
MKHAKKLKLDIDLSNLNRAGKVIGRHGFTSDFPKERLVRKFMPAKQVELFKQTLPESVRAALMNVNYSEIRLLRAHVHVDDEAVINLYQQTNGEKTTFWEGEIEVDDGITFDNGNDYFNVNHDKITPIECFVAEPGDIWLLNVKQPHSVSMQYDERPQEQHFTPVDGVIRYAIQAYFNKPYSFIADELAAAGLVE